MKTKTIAIAMWCIFSIAYIQNAIATPPILNFQGRLTEDGTIINGPKDLAFRIYNVEIGGAPVFVEEHKDSDAVVVASGIINVLIGSLTPNGIPQAVFNGDDKFLEIVIDGNLLPRQKIASTAYAFRSGVSDFSERASTAAYAERAHYVDGATVINITTVTAVSVNVTSVTVSHIVMSSAMVEGVVRVGGGVKVGHSIILGPVEGTPGADNNIVFTNGAGTIKTSDPNAGALQIETSAGKDIIFNPGRNVGVGTQTPETLLHVKGAITTGQSSSMTGGIKLYNSGSAYATVIQAGAATADQIYKLPIRDGNPGQVLATDGSGNLHWTTVSGPAITSITPNTGSSAGGTLITIVGANFQSGATVSIGNNAATNIFVINSGQIQATTPPGVMGQSSDVTIVNPNGAMTSLVSGFTYLAPPCDGIRIGGYCWYLGTNGQSCTTVCSTHGGYNVGTSLYAGSGATSQLLQQQQCGAVADAFGFRNTKACPTGLPLTNACVTGSGDPGSAFGCAVCRGSWCPYPHESSRNVWIYNDPPTTATAAGPYQSRFCACNQ